MEKFSKLMENTFKLRENGTTVKTEIIAGVTTFMTMAYFLPSPDILSPPAWTTALSFTCNGSGSLPWHPADGTFRQLSIRSGTWNGPQRLFRLHRCSRLRI